MNLNTITEVRRPTSRDEIPEWREGYAWLAGGTWLFSTPQIATRTLIDLETLRWPAVSPSANGLEIAATCTIAELERFAAPSAWIAAPLIKLCCHALSDVVQDLQCGDDRREHLHVAACRRHDLSHHRASRRLYAVAARGRLAPHFGDRFRRR